MDLYFIRHGYAEPYGQGGRSDEDRALTPVGRHLLARGVTEMRRRGVTPDVILSSPFRRAVETAELLHAGLAAPDGVAILESLASGALAETLIETAACHQHLARVMIVGHNPEIDAAVRLLAARAQSIPQPMRPSTLAWFRDVRFPALADLHLAGQWDIEELAEA